MLGLFLGCFLALSGFLLVHFVTVGLAPLVNRIEDKRDNIIWDFIHGFCYPMVAKSMLLIPIAMLLLIVDLQSDIMYLAMESWVITLILVSLGLLVKVVAPRNLNFAVIIHTSKKEK